MGGSRFGPSFPTIFTAALLQELSFSLLIHLPGYLSDLGATEALIGILYSASAVISLLLRPVLGRILDLTHRRTVLLVTGAANIAVVLALATTSDWGPYLWGLFLVQRTLQIALFATMLTYGADSIPIENRTQGLALFGLSGLFPIALGGYAGDVVIATIGFGGLFAISAAASAISWLIVLTLPVLPVPGERPRRSFWAALGQKDLLPLWFATLLFSLGLESLFTFTRTYIDVRQVGTAGLFFAVYGGAAAATRIFGGSRYDRIPQRPLMVIAISMFGMGLLVMAQAQSVSMLVLAAAIAGTAHGATFPILSSQVVNRARVSERGSALAIFTSIFDMALLVGAPSVGFLIEGFNYLVAFSVTGTALIAGALVYAIWDRWLVASTFVGEEVFEH